MEKQYNSPEDILEDAVKLIETKEYTKALLPLNHLLNWHGPNAPVLFYIATCQMNLGNDGLAKVLLYNSLNMEPEFIEAWNNLGFCYHERGMYSKASECFQKAYEFCIKKGHKNRKETADLINNIASIYINNGTPREAIDWCDKGLEINPDHPNIKWNRGLASLELGNWEDGWEGYEAGKLKGVANRLERNYDNDEPPPTWEGTAGKSVVVFGEQGIGDEIMFASMIPDAMNDINVIFECHPRLQGLFRRSFNIPVYGTRKDEILYWPPSENIDAKIHIGSLGKFYRLKDSDFPKKPYLKPDPWLVEQYKERMKSDKPKIAIHWKGGSLKTNKDYRSMPLERMKEFILNNNADYYSLQYTPEAREMVQEFNKKYGTNIIHWQETVDDFDETAALLANVDLLISVCTSVVHLAGAMGVKCWCLCPSKPAWRYGVKGDMPWYESVKLYRQKDGDWDEVLKQVNHDLGELCSSQKSIESKTN